MLAEENGNMKMEADLFQSLKLVFDDVHSDYSGMDIEALTLLIFVEQRDGDDDDDGNKWIGERKRFANDTTDDEVQQELEGKVKF